MIRQSPGHREPIFNVPTVIIVLLAAMATVHALRSLLPEPQSVELTLDMALIPARFGARAADLPGGRIAGYTSLFTHMLVHGDLTHLGINSAWLLAFGGAVAHRIGTARFLLCFILFGLAGAALFLAVNPNLMAPMVGASGAISGLMGATMRFLFSAVDGDGVWRLREQPRTVPLMSLSACLRDRRIVSATVIWLALNLLAVLGLGGLGSAEGGIAWEAHVGGYLAGFLGFGWLDPVGLHPPDDAAGNHVSSPNPVEGTPTLH